MSTYTPLASGTLSSNQSSISFTNISQDYNDLILKISSTGLGGDNNSNGLRFRLNGDASSNYSSTYILSNSSVTTQSGRESDTRGRIGFIGASSNLPSNVIAHFMNYSNTNTYKTVLGRSSTSSTNLDSNLYLGTSLWRSNSAINSITLSLSSNGNIASGTIVSLYGVSSSVSAQAKAYGGDTIVTDGTYWYHTFYSSGTFTPTQALTADYLVVAGGGGGGQGISGNGEGGGGGAGGLRCTVTATGGGGSLESALSLTAQAYTVTVGAGGAAGTSGSDSVFSTITSTGGGRGGTQASAPAVGGSGGGGYGRDATNNTGAAGTSNQGYAGQSGVSFTSGGGGGAAEVGGTDATRDGGDGVATSISGSSVTYAGGGGGTTGGNTGGTGGTGGGGNGDSGSGPGAGTANTGGGGGGGRSTASSAGGAGGSGIIIVRYSV